MSFPLLARLRFLATLEVRPRIFHAQASRLKRCSCDVAVTPALGKDKQPYYIKMRDDRVFAFAGLWDVNKKISPTVESCTIVTTTPNTLMSELHDRMPAILSKSGIDAWLDPKNDNVDRLLPLLAPYPDAEMEAYPVSTLVNSVKNYGAECIERVSG
jgi:putative SOS response-associated peptidase YedK